MPAIDRRVPAALSSSPGEHGPRPSLRMGGRRDGTGAPAGIARARRPGRPHDRWRVVAPPLLLAAGLCLPAAAGAQGGGLTVPSPDAVWPQWQARLAVQVAARPAAGPGGSRAWDMGPGGDAPGTADGAGALQGAALLGEYTFAQRWFGRFHASGGVVVGATGGAPRLPALGDAGPGRLGWMVRSGAPANGRGDDDLSAASPYLGLGYRSAWWDNALSLSAEVGYLADRTPAGGAAAARALFGSQGLDRALREMRLAPVVQLGLRYTF